MEENQKAASAGHGESGYSGPQETDADVAAEELLIQSPWQRKPGRKKTEAPFPVPPIIFWNYYAFAAAFFFRKKPPAMHTSTATPATMAEPSRPETVVPAALSLLAKA